MVESKGESGEYKMGTWGASNFENDSACDFLVAHVRKILDEVRAKFIPENYNRSDFLETWGESQVIPALDICITLSIEYDVTPQLDLEMLHQWKTLYLEIFDRNTYTYRAEFKAERRVFVVETFDRLEKYIKTWDSE
jgi:hypothetical protein